MASQDLTKQQKRAAEMVARGERNRAICESLDIGESTLLRWKRREDFRAIVSERAISADSANNSSIEVLENARDDEIVLMVELREALEQMARVIGKRLKNMTDDEIGELPIRLVPTFLNSFSDGLGSLQNAHDRLTGYGLLLKELGTILESSDTTTKAD